jgi:hypothetical protein
MICIQSTGGIERRNTPVFVCDVCKKPITDVRNGAAVFRGDGHGENELNEVLHVHLGACHAEADTRMAGGSVAPSQQLADHFNGIASRIGFTIRDIINKEVGWTGALTPDQHNELQDRITELGNWLRQHGASSPLWSEI